jgi:hypothetical protein
MSNKITYIIATLLLVLLFITCILSIREDTLTFDEVAHLPAGYSYLVKQDYRMNPEHPPLVKDLSAVPLLFLDINFPEESSSWQEGSQGRWWVQFNFGDELLYYSGNNADQMAFWGRIPMILLLIFFGGFLFKWTRELRGNKIALLVLTLFSFSPTFIAHGRLVTTDVAAALGAVISTYYYLKFLKEPNKKNIIFAGIAVGISLVLKFSLILLLPFLAVITLVFAWLKARKEEKPLFNNIFKYVGLAIAVALISVIFVVWPIYKLNMINYPPELQQREAAIWLETTTIPEPLINFNLWMTENPVTRPVSQYLLGLLMATNRTATGNTTYFLGIVSAAGWWFYFPVIYLIKVPLAFHIIFISSMLACALLIKKGFHQRIKDCIWERFTEFSMAIFIIIYLVTSITGSLNIGVRHLLPIFPFLYILSSIGISDSTNKTKKPLLKKGFAAFILLLLAWYVSSSIMIFPHYLTFFNEIVGGPEEGYKYAVDSNLDWGQDLKRLNNWTEKENINKIYLDYFGGGKEEYHLGDKFVRWENRMLPEEFPKGNYLAISASQLQGGRGTPSPSFDQPADFYAWLNNYEPVEIIGRSIFVYYIE